VYPRISPDDQRIVFANGSAGRVDLWLHQIARDTPTRLTFDRTNIRPIWFPDGKEITFTSSKEGALNLYSVPADGSAPPQRLLQSAYPQFANSWSPDGRHLGFTEIHPETNWDLWVLPRGERTPQPFLRTPFSEGWMEFSPNGRWVAYTSNESGRWEVYVRPFPGPGGKVQISSEGGTEALWSRNGRELFYRNRARMMAVDVTLDPTFSAAKPRLLFEARYEMGTVEGMTNYDVSRDGERFLMLKNAQGAAGPPLDVVLNWFSELSRRAPAGK
jgi:Tol biopolymer transport system component